MPAFMAAAALVGAATALIEQKCKWPSRPAPLMMQSATTELKSGSNMSGERDPHKNFLAHQSTLHKTSLSSFTLSLSTLAAPLPNQSSPPSLHFPLQSNRNPVAIQSQSRCNPITNPVAIQSQSRCNPIAIPLQSPIPNVNSSRSRRLLGFWVLLLINVYEHVVG
jgi:hypothetical protein